MKIVRNSMIILVTLFLLVSIGGCSSPISNNVQIQKKNTEKIHKDAVFKKLTTCKEINNEIEGYFFVDKENCDITNSCKKAIFFLSHYQPLDDNYFVVDIEKKLFNTNKKVCFRSKDYMTIVHSSNDAYYVSKKGNIFNFKHKNDSKFQNNIYYRAGKRKDSKWAMNFFKNDLPDEYEKVSHFKAGLNSSNTIKIEKNSINTFTAKYKINDIIQKWIGKGSKEWKPEKGNTNQTINGKGKIIFYKGSKDGGFNIKGYFENGKLINGTLYLSYTYGTGGGILAAFAGNSSLYYHKNIKVTSSSNLTSIMDREFKKLKIKAQNTLNERARNRASSSSSNSSSSSSYTPKYGCKFCCTGQFGNCRSKEFKVNTPATTSMEAQDYIRQKYRNTCKEYPFYSNGVGTASVSYPYCETYYYED